MRSTSDRPAAESARWRFILYVAGDSPNSTRARINLLALCRRHLPERHDIEIVDVLVHPRQALRDGVRATPTLVRCHPEPERRILGDLSRSADVLAALDLPAKPRGARLP